MELALGISAASRLLVIVLHITLKRRTTMSNDSVPERISKVL